MHENVVFSVCALMGIAVYIISKKRLFTGTVPVNEVYLTGTVPVNKAYLTGTLFMSFM